MYAPNASYLRVYEPVSAFADAGYWRAYAASGRAPSTGSGPRVRREALYERLGWPWRVVPSFPREAYVIERDGAEPLVCPWNLRYRIAQSALELRRLTPEPLAEALAPSDFLASAAEVVARDAGTDRRPDPSDSHEQIASWSVPLRWFACVRADDRDSSGGRLRYRTPMVKARTQIAEARSLVRSAFGDDVDLAVALAEVAVWLDGFAHESVVELDYGGVASRMGPEALREEDSVELTWEALGHLGAGRVEAAQDCYAQLVERWRDRRLSERLN